MTDKPDIVEYLLDFVRRGNTAVDRVYLREHAALEILNLRERLKYLESTLKTSGGTRP